MSASLKTPQVETLKIAMIQRAISVEKLARDCSVKAVTFRNQIAANFPSLRLRLLVEGALNLPIWSTGPEYIARQELSARCGFDPFVLSALELRQHVTKLKIRGRSKNRHKGNLISLIQHHFSDAKTNDPNPPKRKTSNIKKQHEQANT